MSLRATAGTIINQRLSTLRLIGNVASTGPGTGTLVVDGGLSVSNQVYINSNLFVPSGTVTTNVLKVNGGTTGYVLKNIDGLGTCNWELDEDYRFVNDTPTTISLSGRNLGLNMTDSPESLGVSGNIIFPYPDSKILFNNTLRFNEELYFGISGNIGVGVSQPTEHIDVAGNIKLGGIIRVRNSDYTFPDITDTLVGVSGEQRVSNKTLIQTSVSGNMDFLDSGRIINLNDPELAQDAATKYYVDNLINGLVWKNPVIERGITGPPPLPISGDRYIVGSVGAERAWVGFENQIVEYNGSIWVNTITTIGDVAPIDNETRDYIFTGTEWIYTPTIISSVIEYNRSTPPATPQVGDTYIVSSVGSTGAWVNYGNQIVEWNGVIWMHTLPSPGSIYTDGNVNIVYNGSLWVISIPLSPVKNIGPVVPPGSLVIGDRYIIGTIGVTGIFATRENNIAEYTVFGWLYNVPVNGTALLVKEEEKQYVFNGESWVFFGALLSHGNLINLTNSDDHTQYALLAGRNGGQQMYGGTTLDDDLYINGNRKGDGAVILNNDIGRVGIGLNTPQAKLHIYDTTVLTQMNVDTWKISNDNSSFTITDTTQPKLIIAPGVSNSIQFMDGAGIENLRIDDRGTTIKDTMLLESIDTSALFTVENKVLFIGSTVSSSLEDIQFGTNDTKAISIKSSGNVGILQTNPTARLVIGENIQAHNGMTIGTTNADTQVIIGETSSDSLYISWKTVGYTDISTGTSTLPLVLQSNNGNVGIGTTLPIETLDVLGNVRLSGILRRGTENFILPQTSDTLLGTTVFNVIQNKALVDTTVSFVSNIDYTTKLNVSINSVAPNTTMTLNTIHTTDRVLTLPDITDTLVTKNTVDILTNKSLSDTSTTFINTSVPTKQSEIQLSNATSNTKTILDFIQTTDRILTFPDITDTIVTRNTTDVLTNKTLVGPVGISGGINVTENSTFDKDVTINGTLFINGNQTYISNTVIQVEDNLIHIAKGNPSDILDAGLYNSYIDTGVTKFSGLYRDSTTMSKPYRLFKDLTVEPTNLVDRLDAGYTKADLILDTIDAENIRYLSNLTFNDTQAIFTPDGKFGLNTTPSVLLHVNGDARIGTQIYTDNTQLKVGLHNSSPVASVDVNGNMRITTSNTVGTGTVTTNGTTTVTGSGTNFTILFVIGDRITINSQTQTVVSITSDTELTVDTLITSGTSQTYLYSPAGLTVNNQMVFSDRGYLGIGTVKPMYPLQVTTSSTTWSGQFINGQSTVSIGNNSGEGMSISTGTLNTSSYGLRISNNNTTLFRVQTNGFVGMGTNTPTDYLTVDYPLVPGGGAQILNAKIGVLLGSTAFTSFVHNDLKTSSNVNYALKQHNTGDTHINAPTNKKVFINNNDIITATIGSGVVDVTGNLNVSQDVTIDGNLIVSGVSVTLNTTNITVEDPLIKLANGNPFDLQDIGFYGEYVTGGTVKNTGIFRDASDGIYKIFDSTIDVGSTQIPVNTAGYRASDLEVGGININRTLHARGAIYSNVTIVTTDTILDDTMNIVVVDASGQDIIITVPRGRTTDAITGLSYTIVKQDSSINLVKIVCSNTDTIEGQTNIDLNTQYDDVSIYNIGSAVNNSNNGIWLIR